MPVTPGLPSQTVPATCNGDRLGQFVSLATELNARVAVAGYQQFGIFLTFEDERAARDQADAAMADGLQVTK